MCKPCLLVIYDPSCYSSLDIFNRIDASGNEWVLATGVHVLDVYGVRARSVNFSSSSGSAPRQCGKTLMWWWWWWWWWFLLFLACEALQRMLTNFLAVLFLSFFFEVEISLHTLIPLFMPGSVHSGSESWDNCGQMFPDKLRVRSFPDRFPHYACTVA